MSGGGGGGGPSEVTQISTNLPEYARPYYEELLGRTAYESTRPYTPYQGQRLADFTPTEVSAMNQIARMGAPASSKLAETVTRNVALDPRANLLGEGQTVAGGFDFAPSAPGYEAGDFASGYSARSAPRAYGPAAYTSGYQAGGFNPRYQAGTLDVSGFTGAMTPERLAYESQYGALTDVGPGFTAGTMADPDVIGQYMNPYQRLVTDIEKREARRQSEMSREDIMDQATAAGALGGYREAIMQSERERNLGQLLSDIEARGGQQAFQQAQQAFEADRQARLAEAQDRLQRATTLEEFQQAEEQLRQAGFGLGQEALTRGAGLQIDAFQAGEQARQEAARLGLSAQQQEEAARQAEEEFSQRAFQLGQGERQFGAQFELDAYRAGEAARQEAARLGLSARQQEEAARQAQEQFRQQTEERGFRAAETGTRLGLAGLDADRAAVQSRLGIAQLLGQIGQTRQGMDLERFMAQQAAGQTERELLQRSLDLGYEDFLRQQAFPREQIGLFSNILRGLPVQPGSTTAAFGQQPSRTQQLLGSGIAGVGLYNALRGAA